MRTHLLSLGLIGLVAVVGGAAAESPRITWKKTVIDKKFRSEGVAIADVNKDGKMDILAGEVWYQAPDWKMHTFRTPPRDYGDGLRGYSESFCCWTEDYNGDGWVDVLVIRFPGAPCYWYENPQGKDGLWKEHLVWDNACNETPQYVDLFGTGKRVLVMGAQPKGKGNGNEGSMAWFRPGPDPTKPWEMHPISEPGAPGKPAPGSFKFSHGLGIGDVNQDGRPDVVCTDGWYEQPAKVEDRPWVFHKVKLGEACADMYVIDVTGDKKPDILSSSAHKFGIWCHDNRGGGSEPTFLKRDLFPDLLSETHALHLVDINGDGLKDLVTGKRWWSHGRSEPGSDKPSMIYWFEAKADKSGFVTFTPHEIDNASGIGTQFVVDDFNGDGLLDVITSNKRGVFLIEQVRAPQARAGGDSPVSFEQPAGRATVPTRSLFNGSSLDGWDTYLNKPYKGTEAFGLNNDPLKVFGVTMVDGVPAIRISGEVFGAITSKEEFENYHVHLEFKWGEKKYPPRDKAVRDSGLLYHCVGPHGKGGGNWMQSLECQIQEHDCGDFWSVAGVIVDVEGTRKDGKGPIYYQKGGEKFTVPSQGIGPRIVKDSDHEKPTGEWNTIDVYTVGQTSVHLVNGKPNLVLTGARIKTDGKEVPLTRGKIQIQSEGAEVFYRNITVTPIKEIPASLLK